jgi:uncharacterized protein (DUF58 family)
MRIVLLILVPLIVLGIALAGTHILVERLFILMAIIIIISGIFAWISLWGLKGKLKDPSHHIEALKPFQIEAVAENKNILPKAFVKLMLKTGSPAKDEGLLCNLPTRGSFYWQQSLVFSRRGSYKIGPLIAEVSDPFGLFRLHRSIDKGKKILVYPPMIDLPQFEIESKAETGIIRRNMSINESGGSISGVREYVPGDNLNRIHWPSTAHTGKLIVKEFDIDLSEKIWVIPDLNREANFDQKIEECGITIAASLVRKYADSGRQVGLIAHDENYHFFAARPGSLNLWRILETLAVVKVDGEIPISRLLSRAREQLYGNSIAFIITASNEPEILDSLISFQKRGIQSVLISIDAFSFGGHDFPENIKLKLRTLNIPIFKVRKGEKLSEVLNTQSKNLN